MQVYVLQFLHKVFVVIIECCNKNNEGGVGEATTVVSVVGITTERILSSKTHAIFLLICPYTPLNNIVVIERSGPVINNVIQNALKVLTLWLECAIVST